MARVQRGLMELLRFHPTITLATSDVDGIVTMCTPALQQLLGRPVEGFSEWDIAGDVLPMDFAQGRALRREELPLARALRGEVVVDLICTLRTTAGRVVHLRCNAAPLRAPGGETQGAFCLMQDVTDEWSADLVRHKLRDRLVTTVNHGLRTPMTIILGHAELMNDAMSRGEVPETLHQSVSVINAASGKLKDLAFTVSHLVDVDEATPLDAEPCDLAFLLRESVLSHHDTAAAKGLVLRLDVAEALPATIDSALVRLAVEALMDNAIRFAPAGTQVTVSASSVRGAVEVRVADHGPGIPAADRERLVRPFERGTRTGSEDPALVPHADGLGLAFARAVCVAHGGALSLDANGVDGLVVSLGLSPASERGWA